jgi:hypothetical protein
MSATSPTPRPARTTTRRQVLARAKKLAYATPLIIASARMETHIASAFSF